MSGNTGEGIYVADDANAGQRQPDRAQHRQQQQRRRHHRHGGGHTLTGNTANFNDGWGIFAEPGTIDGGGNKAVGNAEPAQCSGVVCTIGVAPGAPDTVDRRQADQPVEQQPNALFTFIGTDDTTPLFDLEFECRLDSTDELDCVGGLREPVGARPA